MIFEREAHRVVLAVLEALRADVLLACKFLFGGGTRIVLELDEYRESKDIDFLWHHDEAAQVYVNGVIAARSGQHTTGYVEQRMREEGRRALKPGKNVIAVHCQQTTGGQYVDVGLIRLVEKKRD